MKSSSILSKMTVAGVLALVLLALEATAQVAVRAERRVAGGNAVRITQLTGIGARSLMRSPDITRGSSRRAESREWVELGVQYDTEAEWIDDLAFTFYALMRDRRTQELTLLKGVATYLDIAQGRGHMGVAYIRPAALARFGAVVAVAVEASAKGAVVATESEGKLGPSKPLPKDWWKNPKLVPREGYILDKSKTPFVLVNYDDYEALK